MAQPIPGRGLHLKDYKKVLTKHFLIMLQCARHEKTLSYENIEKKYIKIKQAEFTSSLRKLHTFVRQSGMDFHLVALAFPVISIGCNNLFYLFISASPPVYQTIPLKSELNVKGKYNAVYLRAYLC